MHSFINFFEDHTHTHTQVIQKVVNFIHKSDWLCTSHICMSLTSREIKTEIWISFSSFIRSFSMLSQQKCLALLSSWELAFFNDAHVYKPMNKELKIYQYLNHNGCGMA